MRGLVVLSALVVTLAVGAGKAAANAVVPVEGGWMAETSAGLPVHFGVEDGRVVNTRFQFRWGFCGIFGSHDPSADVEVDPAGHWAYEDPRGQTLEGTFVAADRVEGRVISVERELPGCPRTEATFTATPAPPNPESMAAARAGIEALPYPIRLREPRAVDNVLIGSFHGKRGDSLRFFLFVNRGAAARLPGVAGYGLRGRHLEGGALANTDVMLWTPYRRGAGKAQRRARIRVLRAVRETVCRRQTGEACPTI